MMRTTLTVDDDLLRLARQRAEQQGLPLADVINHALRRGLAEAPPSRVAEATLVYGEAGGAGPDDAALRAWSQRLDEAELARKLTP